MAISCSTYLTTKFGVFKIGYHTFKKEFCVSLSMGQINRAGTIVRLHSSCLFSESLHSVDCDCCLQLTKALEVIGNEDRGVIIYLYQEGRGLGLENKIKAMELERTKGLDTAEAFTQLHFDLDPRRYDVAIQALRDLGVNQKVRLITNNPRKRKQLEKGGFEVIGKIDIKYPVNSHVKKYLKAKQAKLGHEISKDLLE